MKEKILGKTVGKAGISQVLIIKTTFIMAICIILGFFLIISSLVNWGKNYFEFLFWIGIFVVAFVPIQFLRLKMDESSVGKYIFYENGFEDVLKKKKIFFKDVKNYVEFVLKNEFDKKVKNQDDFEFKFGIIEEIDSAKDKILSLNMDKNLEKVKISEYIFLDKNGIRMENQKDKILENYFWKEIGKITVLEKEKNEDIQIESENGEVIFSKNMKYIEKPELFIKVAKNIFKFYK